MINQSEGQPHTYSLVTFLDIGKAFADTVPIVFNTPPLPFHDKPLVLIYFTKVLFL